MKTIEKLSRKSLPYLVGLVGLLGCDQYEYEPIIPPVPETPHLMYMTRKGPESERPPLIIGPNDKFRITYGLHGNLNQCYKGAIVIDYISDGQFDGYGSARITTMPKPPTEVAVDITAPSSGDCVFHGCYILLDYNNNQEIYFNDLIVPVIP